MFFKKNQKKIDPKIRFQHASFIKQIKQVSNYKREAKARPEHPAEKFLEALGLDSWLRRISVLGILLALIYFCFIPNIFLCLVSKLMAWPLLKPRR